MKKKPYRKKQLYELLYQALETERGGIKIYETALTCAQNKELNKEGRNCDWRLAGGAAARRHAGIEALTHAGWRQLAKRMVYTG